MKKDILNIKGVSVISKETQSKINGGDWTQECGCDCAGNVTGPPKCQYFYACPQIYTC